ncbi:hypothetical protein EYC84_005809 [Monilinia fructicola]|uniref:Uncharacterized protein n=1 Tax=Monilinia fructicola TaxID=38448 RepID=A0A5M9K097_MONFR|nr:hypothetical protein EYC84_005809 [Monilinia fructicola]
MDPFWLPYGSSMVRLCQRLGIAPEKFTRIYTHSWEANERAQIHVDYGDAFLIVHPAGIQLCGADATLVYDILTRKTEFRRNMEEMAVLNVYGKNSSTVDDAEWQAHRKLTTVTFPEKKKRAGLEIVIGESEWHVEVLDTTSETTDPVCASGYQELHA